MESLTDTPNATAKAATTGTRIPVPATTTLAEPSPEEQTLQEFWDKQSFALIDQVVQSRIQSATTTTSQDAEIFYFQEQSSEITPSLSPEYQPLFARLLRYDQNDDNVLLPPDDTSEQDLFLANRGHPSSYRYCFRLDLAYRGPAFCGWQTQTPEQEAVRSSVQKVVEDWLQPRACLAKPNKKKSHQKHQNQQQGRVDIRSAGRTDSGVHAVGQVTRFRTWIPTTTRQQEGDEEEEVVMSSWEQWWRQQPLGNNASMPAYSQVIRDYINSHPRAGHDFACVTAQQVTSQFHPTFAATGRAYLYVMDWNDTTTTAPLWRPEPQKVCDTLNALLEPLVQLEHDYLAFSYGKIKTETTLCTLAVARAFVATLESSSNDDGPKTTALCIQLVGNRFLRRMVRILVATALREAIVILSTNDPSDETTEDPSQPRPSLANNRLVEILQSLDRSQSARSAPPQGLVFASAAF